jgi:polysaccharide biosynthesis/export protein
LPASSWVGASLLRLLAIAAAVCLVGSSAGAEEARSAGEPASTTAEIRIGLPEGLSARVALTLGEGGIALELPRGAMFPLDVASESKGLAGSATVTTLSEDRVRFEIKFEGSLLEGVEYGTTAVVLKVRRRGISIVGGDEANQYRLGPEDKIYVTIGGNKDLSRQFVIGGNGSITGPLVGEVSAAGLTPQELAAKLTELLARDYLVNPQVDVEVVEYKSKWVMVGGEVRIPGRVALRAASTLKDVLADAGGFAPDAGETISISHQGDRDAASTVVVLRSAFESGAVNPALVPGDMVTVDKRTYVYVLGEVRNSSRVAVERGLTLLKALAMAGGLTEWASKKDIQILSENPGDPPRTYNLKDIEKRKIPDPPLSGGESVIVRRRIL